MEPVKTIKLSKKHVNKQMIMGVVLTILGVVGLVIGAAHILGLGIFFLVIAIVQKERNIFKIFENNLEMKMGPIAPTKYIRFTDFTRVENIEDKKITVYYKDAGKERKIRLHSSVFESDDIKYLLDLVDKNLQSAA